MSRILFEIFQESTGGGGGHSTTDSTARTESLQIPLQHPDTLDPSAVRRRVFVVVVVIVVVVVVLFTLLLQKIIDNVPQCL